MHQLIFNVNSMICVHFVDFDYCSTHTIRITIEDKVNNHTQDMEVIENGKIEDLLSELHLTGMQYDIRVNDQRGVSLKDSFLSQNIKTNDKLASTTNTKCFII